MFREHVGSSGETNASQQLDFKHGASIISRLFSKSVLACVRNVADGFLEKKSKTNKHRHCWLVGEKVSFLLRVCALARVCVLARVRVLARVCVCVYVCNS